MDVLVDLLRLRRGQLLTGCAAVELGLGSVMAANDLAEDHWHVGPVAVEPGFQGIGIGRALMIMLCDHFDARGELAWLETDKIENVNFYTSLGFEVFEKIPVLTAAYWFMRRDAR